MKRNFLDRVIGFFSPAAEAERVRHKGRIALMERAYEAAKNFSTDDWTSASSGSANKEIGSAQKPIRNKARHLIRNNPYANRALNGIVGTTVGSGIVPNIKGRTELQQRRIRQAWKEWGETTLCDSFGVNNFYGLQSLVLRSVVESGEIIALKEVHSDAMKCRVLESDYIATYQNSLPSRTQSNVGVVQGVKVDENGRSISYILYKVHPDDQFATTETVEVPVEKLVHVFKKERPGQLRGISWFHPVIRQLEDLNEFLQATLISKKISACFTAFITTDSSNSSLPPDVLKKKRESESTLTPATIRYLDDGESIQFGVPPAFQDQEYVRQTLRSIASGLNVTFEILTSDYSQVNYSSGRMAHIEFRKSVEAWRWLMLIPQFCDPMFLHFLLWCEIRKGIDTKGVTVEWVPPTWTMIDPEKEVSAISKSVRIGLTSLPKAQREQGYDPDELMPEIADSNKKIDSFGMVLDSDPRKTTQAGQLQMTNSNNNSGVNNSEKDDQTDP